MITLVQRLWGWLRHLLTFVERGEDRSEEWPHTVADVEPPSYITEIKTDLDQMPPGSKVFDDGLIGVPHPLKTLADYADIDKLRAVYGKTIPDAQLIRWSLDAQDRLLRQLTAQQRLAEINDRLAEIETEAPPKVPDSGYRPVSGPKAGTSAKTGIVLPPAVADLTTREWVDLRLEKAYGIGKMPSTVAPGRSGFSMRHLNTLARRAELRDATLSPYDLAVLRSRGLV